MRPISRLLDQTISVCFGVSSGPITSGSPTSFVNNRPIARLGDSTVTGPIVQGSNSNFCDNRPIARLGDRTACGVIVTGSNDTFVQ